MWFAIGMDPACPDAVGRDTASAIRFWKGRFEEASNA